MRTSLGSNRNEFKPRSVTTVTSPTTTNTDPVDSLHLLNYEIPPLEEIKALIKGECSYQQIDDNRVIASLILHNGLLVTGECYFANPNEFDLEVGKSISRENAEIIIWRMLQFYRYQQRFETKQTYSLLKAQKTQEN